MIPKKMTIKEAIISIVLGIPDGVTYSYFGFMSGIFLAQQLGFTSAGSIHFFEYCVGLLAAVGVACFAINNVSREYRKLQQPRNRLNPALRIPLFLVALLSVIPFTGMALEAGSHFFKVFFVLLVISNTLARFCMNDFALVEVFTKCRDFYYRKHWKKYSHLSMAIVAVGFLCGTLTATYLYYFAHNASVFVLQYFNINSQTPATLFAIAGVVPTALLWGHDAALALTDLHRVLSLKPSSPTAQRRCSTSKRVVTFGALLTFALCGAFSETRMAYHAIAGQAHTYVMVLMICVPIAFAGVYSTGVIQLINKSWR